MFLGRACDTRPKSIQLLINFLLMINTSFSMSPRELIHLHFLLLISYKYYLLPSISFMYFSLSILISGELLNFPGVTNLISSNQLIKTRL